MSGASPVWASRISTSAAIGMIPPAFDTGVHTATLGRVAVLVVMGPWAAANRSLRPAMHLAFGIAEVELVGLRTRRSTWSASRAAASASSHTAE